MPRGPQLHRTVLALTAAAASLPGIGRAAQGADELTLDYQYSAYRENDLPASRSSVGQDQSRYEVNTHQFRLFAPVGDETGLGVDLGLETMSGASPWYILPGPAGEPLQVMSGATIHDKRTSVQLQGTRQLQKGQFAVHGGYSSERDYRALSGGVEARHELADTVSTVSGGAGYSGDQLDPVDGGTAQFPDRIPHARRHSYTAFAGYARVLDADTVVQTSLSYTLHEGFLADPYKRAYVDPSIVPDSRPGSRRQWSWLTRLRRFFAGPDAALHADYRLYRDDWNSSAHTLDVAWHQNLPRGWRLVPAARWYSQDKAYFYEPYYTAARSDGLASSDYRLSPYGALSLSLDASTEISGWGLRLRYEWYDSGAGYALDSVPVENPGLVSFDVISVRVGKTF